MKRFVLSSLSLLAAGFVFVAAITPVCAEEDISERRSETQLLLERLERAEAQIRRLEEQNDETPTDLPIGSEDQEAVLFNDSAESDSLTDQLRAMQAENETLQAQQTDLGKKYESLSKSHEKLLSSYDKFSADLKKGQGVVIPGDPNVTLKINARIHADYWAFPSANAGADVLEGTPVDPVDPQDRFGLRRVRFRFGGDIKDNMFYRFDLELANPRNFEWRDAYLGFKNLPGNQELVIGHQKRPYGWDTLNSSNANIFLERPLVQDFMNGDYRRLGIQINGVSDEQDWNWQYGVFNGDFVQDSDSFYVGNHYQLEAAGRLANTWWYDEDSGGRGWGHWAIAGAVARPDGDSALNNTARFATRPEGRTTDRWMDTRAIVGAQTYEILALENAFNAGPFHAVGEVMNMSLQRNAGGDLNFWGAYGEVAYMLTGEHMSWNRKSGTLDNVKPFENFFLVDRMSGGTGSGWGAWQVAARYSYLDANSGDILAGVGNSGTLGLVWYLNQNAKFQLNYIHGVIGDSRDLNTAGVGDAEYDIIGARCLIAF